MSVAAGNNPKAQALKADALRRQRMSQDTKDLSLEGSLKQVIADQESKEPNKAAALFEDTKDNAVDAPLVRLVNSLLGEAIKSGASDMHIEPFESMLRVRFRVDGELHEVQKIPAKLGAPITARLKIMADLDICEKRMPQDGCIRFKANGFDADFRLSTLPSVFGEKIVMRVLGKTNLNNDLSKVGMPETQLKILRDSIMKPDGLVLVTGPTGSGKTTTLYAAINELNDISVSVFTAEDPVEGTIPGVTQCSVNTAVGYTFASILRSLLRQDPDVILVGEIRDQETAEICIKASLTGHLVLSTLHTNCAISTISRLVDIGTAPYLITSSVNCIVAQRLVRKICENCKEDRPIPPELLQSLDDGAHRLEGGTFKHGRGCPECHNSGFRGRAPVYEIVQFTDELRRLILCGASKSDMRSLARAQGMITLREAGLDLVKLGMTTVEEVLGVTNEDTEKPYIPAAALCGAAAQSAEQIAKMDKALHEVEDDKDEQGASRWKLRGATPA